MGLKCESGQSLPYDISEQSSSRYGLKVGKVGLMIYLNRVAPVMGLLCESGQSGPYVFMIYKDSVAPDMGLLCESGQSGPYDISEQCSSRYGLVV
ncbi:hypothetical protein DPMN_010893 [Dreissena polymorpha]|uniref:Uncharacterized protein n=1 Tax=Dreissena polymorpha TaxID=45954 RepID=A0A9D4N0Q7_DREPO|nr:hypothetical protein DPMN_010893 [Dreissena polymorpha]